MGKLLGIPFGKYRPPAGGKFSVQAKLGRDEGVILKADAGGAGKK